MNTIKDSTEIKQDIIYSQSLTDTHLSKFDNIDKFLSDAEKIVNNYFKKQKKIKTIEDFKEDLKNMIAFYVQYFKLDRKGRKKFRKQIEFISKNYSELIYFGEEIYQNTQDSKVKVKKVLK